jgi:hypothetical protein
MIESPDWRSRSLMLPSMWLFAMYALIAPER